MLRSVAEEPAAAWDRGRADFYCPWGKFLLVQSTETAPSLLSWQLFQKPDEPRLSPTSVGASPSPKREEGTTRNVRKSLLGATKETKLQNLDDVAGWLWERRLRPRGRPLTAKLPLESRGDLDCLIGQQAPVCTSLARQNLREGPPSNRRDQQALAARPATSEHFRTFSQFIGSSDLQERITFVVMPLSVRSGQLDLDCPITCRGFGLLLAIEPTGFLL